MNNLYLTSQTNFITNIYLLFFRFCVVICIFIPATTANDFRLRRSFYPRVYPLHVSFYLNSSERVSISLLMLSATQENYWYYFY